MGVRPKDLVLLRQLGERVKDRRLALGLSQRELAERIKVSKNAIGLIERGVNGPGLPILIDLVVHLGLSADHLLGIVGKPFTDSSKLAA